MKIALVADEAIDLPENIIEENKIGLARFKLDLQDMASLSGNIYQKTREAERKGISSAVKTSQPSINEFLNLFKEKLKDFESVICVTISSKISGTYNSAIQAKKFLQNEFQDRVHILDSLNASAGEGLVSLKVLSLIKEGLNPEEIISKVSFSIKNTNLLGVYKNPKWLRLSGRFPKIIPIMMEKIEKMSIKPIFTIKDGKLTIARFKRNVKNLSDALFEDFEKSTAKVRSNGGKIIAGITHADDIKEAERLKELILSLKNTEVSFINLTCFPIGGHVGPDSLVLAWREE
ncbi:MAG: DegV family protein [Candidatus Paceibacterota bacterium]|jgi:DegV family protein with EDD domain